MVGWNLACTSPADLVITSTLVCSQSYFRVTILVLCWRSISYEAKKLVVVSMFASDVLDGAEDGP